MATVDRNFNIDFFYKLLELGKTNEALKMIYDLFDDLEEIKKMLFYLSNIFLEKNEFKKAKIIIGEALKLEPEKNYLKYNMGVVNFYLYDFEESLKYLKSIDVIDDYYSYALPYIAYCYIEQKQYEKAYNITKDEKFFDSYDENIYMVGIRFIELQKIDYAIDLFQRMYEKKQTPLSIYGMGIGSFLKKEFVDAVKYFENFYNILKKDKNIKVQVDYLYFGLGISYYETGQYDKAIEFLTYGLERKKYLFELYNYIGLSYKAKNDFSMALEFLRKAFLYEPLDQNYFGVLGDTFFELGDIEYAKKSYQKCFEKTKNKVFEIKIGLIAVMEGNFEEGYNIFKKFLEYEVDNNFKIEILKQLALCSYYIERYEEALIYGQQLLENNVKEERFFLIIGNSLFMLNKPIEAEEIIELSLKFFPESSELLYTLGIVKSNLLKYQEADKIFEKLILRDKKGEYLYAYALTKIRLREIDKAVEIFMECIEFFKQNEDFLYKIGQQLFEIGREDLAERVFNMVLALNPEHKGAKSFLS
ncbi:MAG: tetratricopeptide repeat protein [Brevinematales bacterium]|nr:tetratricopeptide repeat protein [Brevinematales bacterium]